MRLALLFIVFSAVTVGCCFPVRAANSSQQTDSTSSAKAGEQLKPTFDLDRRGKQLRLEVDRTYQQLPEQKKLKVQNDIGTLVLKYIPIGSSFKDAEAILRSAGLNVRIMAHETMSGAARLSSSWVAAAEVYIRISSKTPNDDSVGRVEAIITYATL